MQCENCSFVVSPGQAAQSGTCPNCERPFRDQPTPLNSEMEMRNMPEPGMEDSGGNPLQEGILGDYQNRGVRDESYASVKTATISLEDYFQKLQTIEGEFLGKGYPSNEAHQLAAECLSHLMVREVQPEYQSPVHSLASTALTVDPEFELTDVIVPDPESIRPDKGQMDKKADFLGDIGDIAGDVAPVALPIAGGVGGFMLGGPVGAAAGAAAGSAVGDTMHGDNVGEIAQDAAISGALGGLGGVGAKAVGLGAEEAIGQGATKGGIGSMMKSAWGKVPTQKIQNAYMMHSLMGDASNVAQPMAQPDPGMMQPGQQQMSPSFYSAVDTPTSHGEIPSNNTDDPEEVDFHEKNDGEKDGLQSDQAVNGTGGTDLGPDDFFSPDSGGLASFAELLPKILQFAVSDQSAAGDPDMENLHQKLEAEKPGYMNSPDDDHGSKIVMMIMKGQPDEAGGDDSLQDNDTPHDPISEHEATALRPGLENTCPRCGSLTDPSSVHCPQCGMANPQHAPLGDPTMTDPVAQAEAYPVTAAGASSQGPTNDQQKAQVAELLQQEGRAEEIPAMIIEPWNYADELSKITGGEEPPEDVGQPGPPPPVTPPGQEAGMPMPGMAPPGGASSGGPMMAAVKKYAASVDGFCEACPKCGSHSTGYMDYEEGDAGCKTCGHKWTAPKMVTHNAAGEDMHAAPVAPELTQERPEQEQEHTLGWTDESGAPLKVGQTYEMYSNNYDIPDRIKIDAVKPDVINFTLVGEYGLSHQTELTHEEASVESTSFVPTDAAVEPAAEEAGEGAQPVPGPGDQTDLSTPHEMMTANFDPDALPSYDPKVAAFFDDDPMPQQHQAQAIESDGTGPAWLMDGVTPTGSRVAGANMTPWEQRDYIDEMGDARNSDKLQLDGTHYETDTLSDSFLWG